MYHAFWGTVVARTNQSQWSNSDRRSPWIPPDMSRSAVVLGLSNDTLEGV